MKMAFCALPSWRLAVSRGLYMPGKAVSTPVPKANSNCIIYRRTDLYRCLTYETSNITRDRQYYSVAFNFYISYLDVLGYMQRFNLLSQGRDSILCFVDRVSLYNLFQMGPIRCTIILSTRWFKYDRDGLCVNLATSVPVISEPPCIFISTSLHVSGNYVSIIRRTYCISATLVFFVMYG